MSYNKTIFNTPTIYVDIQEDFNRTLDVLIMVGQLNKIRELEKIKKDEQEFNAILRTLLYDRAEAMFNLDTMKDEMIRYASMLTKEHKNLLVRTPSGRFGSTHKEIDRIVTEGFYDDSYNYKIVKGIYSKMNKQQKQTYFNGMAQFTRSLAVLSKHNEKIDKAEQKYQKATEYYIKSDQQLKEAERNLAKAKTQLKKLGFVAIIKMMNDIEKKARRYKL